MRSTSTWAKKLQAHCVGGGGTGGARCEHSLIQDRKDIQRSYFRIAVGGSACRRVHPISAALIRISRPGQASPPSRIDTRLVWEG